MAGRLQKNKKGEFNVKKTNVKSFILGMAVMAIIVSLAAPAIADLVDISMNGINIRVNGNDVAKQGEMLTLSNGTQVPFSIGYKGTNYLPIGKMAELFGITPAWDGTTRTASLTDGDSVTPTPITGTIPMYSKYPTVPDFGSITGATLAEEGDIGNSAHFYGYYIVSIPDEGLPLYIDTLKECGYEYYAVPDTNEYISLAYKKDKIIVAFAFLTETVFGVVIVPTSETTDITPSPSPTPSPKPPIQPQPGLHYQFTNTQAQTYESYGDVYWETLIEVTNTGTDAMYLGSTKFDLTDETGKILRAGETLSSFPDILHSGEKGYFYADVEVPDATLTTQIKMVPRWDIKTSKEPRTNFDLSEIDIRDGQFGTTVYGKIANNTGEEQNWAIISVVFYSEDDTPLGVWMTNVMEDMPVGSKIGFEVSGIGGQRSLKDVTPGMIDHYTAYAYPPQWQF